jgi:heat shock 70kDa protein 1/2/6/8
MKIRNLCIVFSSDAIVNARAMRRLGTVCDRDERTIFFAFVTTIKVDSLFQCLNFFLSFDRAKFEEINMDLFNECL